MIGQKGGMQEDGTINMLIVFVTFICSLYSIIRDTIHEFRAPEDEIKNKIFKKNKNLRTSFSARPTGWFVCEICVAGMHRILGALVAREHNHLPSNKCFPKTVFGKNI